MVVDHCCWDNSDGALCHTTPVFTQDLLSSIKPYPGEVLLPGSEIIRWSQDPQGSVWMGLGGVVHVEIWLKEMPSVTTRKGCSPRRTIWVQVLGQWAQLPVLFATINSNHHYKQVGLIFGPPCRSFFQCSQCCIFSSPCGTQWIGFTLPWALRCYNITALLWHQCFNQPPACSYQIGNGHCQGLLGVLLYHISLQWLCWPHYHMGPTGACKEVPFFNCATICGSVHCSFPAGGFKHQW